MRDLETVLCRLHSRSQQRYPRFTLCPECRSEAPREAIVVEAVVNYFSKPEFREFFIETEHEIQMGSDSRRPDIVILDAEGNFVAIAECKRSGVVDRGYEQLQSYLSATDTQFGVFANSTNPDQWKFYENLRRKQFPPMRRLAFERKIATERTIESIREEKNRLNREITEIRTQLDRKGPELNNLKQKVKQASNELVDIKKEIIPLKKESSDLTKKITRDSRQAEVLEGLKLEFTRSNLRESIALLSTQKDQLQNEIERKEQQRTDLSEEVNLLKGDRDKLESEKNRIKYEWETLEREKEISRERKNYNKYLEQINDNLKKSIKHKTEAVRDLDRSSKLDESIYGQIREELERLDKLESEIKSKQQLARQDQERYAACERNSVETNQKEQQLAQVSEEKESIFKQLRVVVNQLKAASSEQQTSQIEENRRQLVRDFRKRKCIRGKLIKEISRLKEVKSELEEEIRQAGQQLSFEENEVCPVYVQIQLEIDELKTEKSKIEAKIGHQIFLLLP